MEEDTSVLVRAAMIPYWQIPWPPNLKNDLVFSAMLLRIPGHV